MLIEMKKKCEMKWEVKLKNMLALAGKSASNCGCLASKLFKQR